MMKHAWSVLKQQLNPIALWQLIRYGIVGVTTNILGYGVFLLVTSFGVDPKSTMSSFYVLGAVLGFFGNKKLTFSHTGNLYGSIFRYIIAHTIGFTLNFMLLTVFYEWYGYPYQYVQAVAVFVVAANLFVLFKYYVFPPEHDHEPHPSAH
jgi:putative flippase GtrA